MEGASDRRRELEHISHFTIRAVPTFRTFGGGAGQKPLTLVVSCPREMIQQIFAYLLFYPTLWYDMLLSRLVPKRAWYTQIDECVYLGALPMSTYPQELHDIGVKAVINLCQEWNRAAPIFTQLGIDHLHLPTVDFHAPSLELIEKGVEFINQCVKAHKPVYVHCKAGRGRSATVVLCWLLSTQDLSAKEAQKILLHKRLHINKHLWKRKVATAFVERWRGSKRATRMDTKNISQTH